MDDAVWFLWPVTFALVAGVAVHRLLRRRARWAAAVAVVSAAVAVVPLVVAVPVRCGDDDAVLDLRFPALLVGLLGVVAWLAILARLDDPVLSDRRTVGNLVLLVACTPVEFVASSITLAVRCGGTTEPMAWHLGVAAVVLVLGAATGAVGRAGAS